MFSSVKFTIAILLLYGVIFHCCGQANSHTLLQEEYEDSSISRPFFDTVWNYLPNLLLPSYGDDSESSTPQNTTAEATFSNNDVTLVASDHQNATVYLFVRGYIKQCINITFEYSPPDPSIDPIDDIILCPDDFVESDPSRTEVRESHNIDSINEGYGSFDVNDGIYRDIQWDLKKFFPVVNFGEHKNIASGDPGPLLLNKTIDIVSRRVGKTVVKLQSNSPDLYVKFANIRVSVIISPAIEIVSEIFGWVYTIIWDISFLPQVWLNWNRKSVVGFSFDNVALNIAAYLCYSLFNIALYAIPYIKDQFRQRYPAEVSHVQPNDVFFAVYGLGIEIVLAIQCYIYERSKGQRVSTLCRLLILATCLIVLVGCILVACDVLLWLDVFYIMSYLKLVITPLKYIPQLFVNYKLKSTKGFSMTGLLMDFTGGTMSLAQMFLLAANSNDWKSIFTNFSKFGLGVLSILFDVFFFIQYCHYHCRTDDTVE